MDAGRSVDLMTVFRCTRALLKRIHAAPAPVNVPSSGKLGDWFVTVVLLKPQWWLLAVSATTRLPVLWRARPFATMTTRFPGSLREVLRGLGVSETVIATELDAMGPATFAPTNDRSVLGTLNEFTVALRWAREDRPGESACETGLWLADTPILPLHDYPARMARKALEG
jgi:hypothetical protein